MTNTSKKFSRKLNSRFAQKQNEMLRQPAIMGDGNGNLLVTGFENFVYVTVGDKSMPVFNNRVPAQIGVKIWVGYAPEEPTLFQVLSTRSESPAGVETGFVGYAPAKRYEWHALNGGQDPLYVHLRAVTPLRLGVSSTANAATLYADLYRGFVYVGTEYKAVARQDINLYSHIPATTGKAAFVLITIDNTGAVVQTKGSEVDIAALAITDIPAIPAGTVFTCGAIRVYHGQTSIQDGRTNTDFVDLRFSRDGLADALSDNNYYGRRNGVWTNIKTYLDTIYVALTGNQTIAGVKTFSSDPIVPDEAYDATNWDGSLEPPTKNAVRDKIESMSAGGGHVIQDEGTPLTARANLNFVGAGVTATDDAGNNATVVTIPSGGIADAPSDNVYYGRRNAGWTNLKTYFDTLYNLYVHPNHSGDVTSVGDGAQTIAAKAVTLAKMDDMATASLIYRKTAGAGAPEVNTLATVKTDLGLGTLNLSTQAADTKEPTGWADPSNITVSYDSTTQKITLTATSGTLDYYWRGVKTSLASPWTSSAHTNTAGHQYYLSSTDGTNFTWATDTVWTFDAIMVAVVNYQTANKHAHVETHGLMQWQSHEELHRVVGTYKESGGTLDPASYTLLSTTAANRRPNVVATVIHDEDVELTLAALTSKTYNKFYLSGAAVNNFTGETADIVPLSVNNPYYNSYSAPNWGQTLMSNNSYMCVWLVGMPVTSDATSQTYRYIWMQGQSNGTLLSQQALVPADMNMGTLTAELPELVFLVKVIIRYQGGNWDLYSVTTLSGSKFSQVGSAAGAFLSSVTTNGSLTGDGTTGNPLSASSGATTATAAGTTTLTVASNTMQEFTGTTTQTVVLPVVSTLRLGHRFNIVNNSTGTVTVNSSGGNAVATVTAGVSVTVYCILLTGTTAASWHVVYNLSSVDNTEAVAFLNGGTNTHTAVDTHIASTANPHSTTAAQAAAIPNDGWVSITLGSPTRTAATTFTTTTDLTSTWQKGYKLKFTDTTTKYAYVVSLSAYSAGSMTVTIAGNALVGNPSAFSYSPVENPLGFPTSFSYTATFSRSGTPFTNPPTLNSAYYRIVGNKVEGVIDFTMVASAGGTGEIYASVPTTVVTGIYDMGVEVAATAVAFSVNASTAQLLVFYNIYPVAAIATNNGYHYIGAFRFLI